MQNTFVTWIAVLGLLSACGGAQSGGADAPEEEAPTESAEPAAEEGEATAEPEAAEKDAKEETADAGESASASASDRHRSALGTLTAENTRFVLSFERSEAGEAAAEECEQFASKPQKKTACITKARKKITADVLHFVKDDADQWYWITSTQKGTGLKQLSKVKIEIGKDTASSVEVIAKGPGASTTVIDVLDDYTIAMPSKHGRLVYEAKVGLEQK